MSSKSLTKHAKQSLETSNPSRFSHAFPLHRVEFLLQLQGWKVRVTLLALLKRRPLCQRKEGEHCDRTGGHAKSQDPVDPGEPPPPRRLLLPLPLTQSQSGQLDQLGSTGSTGSTGTPRSTGQQIYQPPMPTHLRRTEKARRKRKKERIRAASQDNIC